MTVINHRFSIDSHWGAISAPAASDLTLAPGRGPVASLLRGIVLERARGVQQGLRAALGRERRLEWLDDVYSLVAREKIDDAIDIVLRELDTLLEEGRLDDVDSALAAIDVERLDINLMLSVLTITLSASDTLKRRARFLERVEKKLEEQAPSRVERLLEGLR